MESFVNQVLIGDALEQLRTLPDECVQCVVTSPPYWGLRDYAVKGQLGLEKTPEEYIEKMRVIFAEVRRVLRKDGTLWLNIGDSYAGSGRGRNADGKWNPGKGGSKQESNKGAISGDHLKIKLHKKAIDTGAIGTDWVPAPVGLKQKDLCGIPWRIAFALQADGWYLRSDIIWAKPNPMPESVTDRPTKAHEYIFLLTKSAKYYYDAEAIKEPTIDPKDNRGARGNRKRFPTEKIAAIRNSGVYSMANKRTVWQIATHPFSGAHFATFPSKIPELCIKAGTSEKGACMQCGGPWEKITTPSERYVKILGKGYHDHTGDLTQGMKQVRGKNIQNKMRDAGINGVEYQTLGWRPTCKHKNTETVPCIVLDPFAGAGTTLEVAKRLGRNYIGIELNEKYVRELIEPHLRGIDPMFSEAVNQ